MEILWKRTVFAEFRAISPKLCGNSAFPHNFQTRILAEIAVFHAVHVHLKIVQTNTRVVHLFQQHVENPTLKKATYFSCVMASLTDVSLLKQKKGLSKFPRNKRRIQIHEVQTRIHLKLTIKTSDAASAEEPSKHTVDSFNI